MSNRKCYKGTYNAPGNVSKSRGVHIVCYDISINTVGNECEVDAIDHPEANNFQHVQTIPNILSRSPEEKDLSDQSATIAADISNIASYR